MVCVNAGEFDGAVVTVFWVGFVVAVLAVVGVSGGQAVVHQEHLHWRTASDLGPKEREDH